MITYKYVCILQKKTVIYNVYYLNYIFNNTIQHLILKYFVSFPSHFMSTFVIILKKMFPLLRKL